MLLLVLLFVYLFVLLCVFVEQTIEIMGQPWSILVGASKVESDTVCVIVCVFVCVIVCVCGEDN